MTKTVTLNDNNATFVCHMTSETFPTAYCNCSAGPLTVQQRSFPTTTQTHTSSKNTETITTFVSNSSEGHNFNEISSTKMYFIYGIIVGSTAAFVLVLIGAIICITLRKFKLFTRQESSEQTQVYDEIPEPISPNLSEDTITYAEADTNLSTIHEETVNFPIYNEVKDTVETDKSNNEADDEDSIGMVDNTIYVSSGPV